MLESLINQWNPRNGAHRPGDFKPNSNKKVWWLCSQGHEWLAVIASRTNGAGCPYCSHKMAAKENSLATLFPELSLQWHSHLNGSLTPTRVTPGSNRKVWWTCDKGHDWETTIGERCRGRGCPYCSNRKAASSNNLANKKPEIAAEWHPLLNGKLTPNLVTPGSKENVWWRCDKGHEWQRPVYYRCKHACPYCMKKKVTPEYNLAILFPDITSEFHPEKNGHLVPQQLMPYTDKKIVWLCKWGHEWKCSVSQRTSGKTNCPYCFSQSSRIELRIFAELKALFSPILKVTSRHKDPENGYEIDIYISQLKVGIEVDTNRYHDNPTKESINSRKNNFFNNKGIWILRIREDQLSKLCDEDIIYHKKFKDDKKTHKDIIRLVLRALINANKIPGDFLSIINEYLVLNDWLNDNEYKNLLTKKNISADASLSALYPYISKEWHPTLNVALSPDQVTPGSGQKIWWLCGKKHQWEATIAVRTRGRDCPYCQGSKPTSENNFRAKHPHIALQWHVSKNKELSPENILPTSHQKVWWLCDKGHEWQSTLANRVAGNACPDCTKRRVSLHHNLQVVSPHLAMEWHPTLNAPLIPEQVMPGSKMKVWWLCPKGHNYEATINNRASNNSKCPYCSGQKVTATTSLAYKMPALASEWHNFKNINFSPDAVLPGSSKKVWWLCENKHEWEARISNRSIHKSGCPYCVKKKRTDKF